MRPFKIFSVLLASVSVGVTVSAANPIVEFDVKTGAETPLMASPPWSQKGEPMEPHEGKLVQNAGHPSVDGVHSYYVSPELDGLISAGDRDYAIEFKVKPIGDIPSLGRSNYANLVVAWSDRTHGYNLTINRSSQDIAEGSTIGDLNGGGDRMSKVAEEIDWSVPHTVFIGFRSDEKMFHLYVDNKEVAVVPPDVIGVDPSEAFIDRVAFGDTTTGQGNDIGAEWHFVRVYGSAAPSQ